MRLNSPDGPQQRLPVNPRRHKVAPERRKRVATACNACNVRRVKCSGENPCRGCQSSGRDCVYPALVEKVTLPRSELEELRRRVEQYENELRQRAQQRTDSQAEQPQQGDEAVAVSRGGNSVPESTAAAVGRQHGSDTGMGSLPLSVGESQAPLPDSVPSLTPSERPQAARVGNAAAAAAAIAAGDGGEPLLAMAGVDAVGGAGSLSQSWTRPLSPSQSHPHSHASSPFAFSQAPSRLHPHPGARRHQLPPLPPISPFSSSSTGTSASRLRPSPLRLVQDQEHSQGHGQGQSLNQDPLYGLNPNSSHQHNEPQSDERATTEGRFLRDIDGHGRFLGETSGATFLDYLKEFMSAVFPLANNLYQPDLRVHRRPGGDGTSFLSSIGRYQTYDSRPLHHQDVDPLWLPPPSQIHAMLAEARFFIQDGNETWLSGGIYWWGNLSSIPSLPPTSPQSQPPTLRQDDYRHLALYHMVFAVVSQAAATVPTDNAGIFPSEFYFSRARLILGNPLDITRITITDVAALALMGFYLIEMNRRDAAYMCVSTAMHMSIMHGTHRGWVDESGKRVFWTLYVLDRWLSCLMGRPPTIMDDAIRIPLPCDAPSMPPAAGLKAHVELSRISGHIVCNTYRVSPWEGRNSSVNYLDDAISLLNDWESGLPRRLRLTAAGLSSDPACCLLHMGYNQLVILAIRPVFFAAVRKTFAERLVARNSSLSSHPHLGHMRRCVAAAELNLGLARHILALNHPRKLLQAGLHFIFNAAICLMLRNLIDFDEQESKDVRVFEDDIDFVIAQFEAESSLGSNYGSDCAATLCDLRFIVNRLRTSGDPAVEYPTGDAVSQVAIKVSPEIGAWPQKQGQEGIQQPIQLDQAHPFYDELVSWMDDNWQPYGAYLI